MTILKLEPVPALTIYPGGQSAEESFAIDHPEATVNFLMDHKRKEIEKFTYLVTSAAHSYIDMQKDWNDKGGQLLISDMLRTIPQQIDVAARKQGLAAHPGTSSHGFGLAFDFDTEKLGRDLATGKKFTFIDFHKHLLNYGWEIHPRAFRSNTRAEAWHAQFVKWPRHNWTNKNELAGFFALQGQTEIFGRELEVIRKVCGMIGKNNLSEHDQIKTVQRIARVYPDGIIGPVTRGRLALFDIDYERGVSTYGK